jgi:hypothetical protein
LAAFENFRLWERFRLQTGLYGRYFVAVVMAPENTGQEQAGRFRKGQSGNPSGRPKGARNAATLACEALLDGQAEALTQKAIQMVLDGDAVALRLCLDRIYPPRKDRPVTFTLPPITSARDAADLMAAVTKAVATGNITPSEATEIAKVIDAYVKAYQTAELDERVPRIQQVSDAELMRIVMTGRTAETAARLPSPPTLHLR